MSRTKPQRILMPWCRLDWNEIKQKICEKITSIVDMDSRISSMYPNKLRPRQITELFNTYYTDELYEKDRVPQQIFIDHVIPYMQHLIEHGPALFRGVDTFILAKPVTNISYSRPQVTTLLAYMWFGMFNYKYLSRGPYDIESLPEPSFINIFTTQNIFGLQCLVNYFTRVWRYASEDNLAFNSSFLVIKRSSLDQIPHWEQSQVPISEIVIGEGNVDDSSKKLIISCAHEFIGGDLFNESITQETVILLTHPECLITLLFCVKLGETESITVLGSEKFSQYTGSGSSIKFIGNFNDLSPKGYSEDRVNAMIQRAIIFMDASPATSSTSQFITHFHRDLNKAFCGFDSLQFASNVYVAAGHWSYGFNGSNMQIKFIQQIIAASQSGKSLTYYPPTDEFRDSVIEFINWIKRNNITVGQLVTQYAILIKQCYTGPNSRLHDLDIFYCLADSSVLN